jgi:hypothetical protein
MRQKVISFLYDEDKDLDIYRGLYEQVLALRKIPDWIEHEIITKRILPNKSYGYRTQSDIDRIAYLQVHPTAWYIDADVIPDFDLMKDYKMDPGFVYMARPGQFDFWAILGNGCQSYFDFLMNFYEEQNKNPRPLWPHKIINDELVYETKPIPKEFFQHFQLNGTGRLARESGFKISGLGYQVQYKDKKWIVKIL